MNFGGHSFLTNVALETASSCFKVSVCAYSCFSVL
jgi:hypothetical protein